MTHDERVNQFLATRNMTMESALALPVEARKQLDTEFRAAERAERLAAIEPSTKISRATLRKFFPIGQAVTLVYAMGSDVSKPRIVAEHKSYGFEMRVPDGRFSGLRHDKGETILLHITKIENGTRDIVTILDSDNIINVQYHVDHLEQL